MKSKPFLKKPIILALFLAFASIFIISCKKTPVKPQVVPYLGPPNSLSEVYYHWGDLNHILSYNTDIIQYDKTGKISNITSVPTYPLSTQTSISIAFTYQGNQIKLNTAYNDIYQLDNNGRVILHNSTDTQQGLTFTFTEQYIYDSNGYLSEILLTFDGTILTDITYKVQNGNYISYTVADVPGGEITRHYDFTYSNIMIKSPLSFFTPVFGDNSYVAIEKYLNFGKQSVNLLSIVNYSIAELDGSVQTGTLPVTSQVDAQGNLAWLSLSTGADIPGEPQDAISPLPRFIGFTYNP